MTRLLCSRQKKNKLNNASIERTTTGTATATPSVVELTPVFFVWDVGQALAEVVTVKIVEAFELDASAAFPVIFVAVMFATGSVKFRLEQSDLEPLQVNPRP